MSIQEALFNAVPMITFPVFAEQDYNSERLHRTKRGIRLEITDFSQQDLEDALHKLLNDKMYQYKAIRSYRISSGSCISEIIIHFVCFSFSVILTQ